MKSVKTIIERAGDGSYSVYMDADDISYLITGTGKNAEEAINSFKINYDDMKRYYTEESKEFEEVEFVYEYDMASFLSYYCKAFSLAGLSRITGVNQGQLSHYVTGHRTPSERTKLKISGICKRIEFGSFPIANTGRTPGRVFHQRTRISRIEQIKAKGGCESAFLLFI